MKKYCTLLFILFSFVVSGQENSKEFVGKWKYKDVYGKKDADEKSLKMAKMFFSDLTFQFNENYLYKAIITGDTDTGIWTHVNDSIISLASDSGTNMRLSILKLEKEELIIKIDKMAFVLQKLPATEMEELKAKKSAFPVVTVTNKQVCKKWYLKDKESNNKRSEKVKEMLREMLKGSYLMFKENGEFELKILGMEELGKWKLAKENTAIITMVSEDEKVWNIYSISDTTLVMVQGYKNEKWTFSIEE